MRCAGRRLLSGVVFLCVLAAGVTAQRARENRADASYAELIERLELGMSALEELGRGDLVEELAAVANEVRQERKSARGAQKKRDGQGGDREREVAKRHVEILHHAFKAYMEAEKPDAADRIEHAIHARKLALAGNRGEKATKVRKTAPPPEELAKLLKKASKLWAEWGHESKAAQCAELAQHFAARAKGTAKREKEKAKGEGDGERAFAMRQVKALRLVEPACREAGDARAAELAHHAYRALEMQLEGRRDGEAREYIGDAPELGQRLELLGYGARLYAEGNKPDRADMVQRAADELRKIWERSREKPQQKEQVGRKEKEAAKKKKEQAARREKAARPETEREFALRLVKALRLAETACREAGRREDGDLAKHAYRALELQLEGRRDEEARQYVERAPSRGARIELLAMAAELWADWGHEKEAAATGKMAKTLMKQEEAREARRAGGEGRERTERDRPREESLENLHRRLREMQRGIDALRHELERLVGERR